MEIVEQIKKALQIQQIKAVRRQMWKEHKQVKKSINNLSKDNVKIVSDFLVNNARKYHIQLWRNMNFSKEPLLDAVNRDWRVLHYVSPEDQTEEIARAATNQHHNAYISLHPCYIDLNKLPDNLPKEIIFKCLDNVIRYEKIGSDFPYTERVLPHTLSLLPIKYQKMMDVDTNYGATVKNGLSYFNIQNGRSVDIEDYKHALDYYFENRFILHDIPYFEQDHSGKKNYFPHEDLTHPLQCINVSNPKKAEFVEIAKEKLNQFTEKSEPWRREIIFEEMQKIEPSFSHSSSEKSGILDQAHKNMPPMSIFSDNPSLNNKSSRKHS